MSMSQRIIIDPVTRIEGHAKISIFLDDAGNVSDAEFHVVEFRGFEKFCEGRPYSEMPGITPRICGICPVSHLLASAKAGDAIMAVSIPPAADKLRRLMNLGQIIQSHALSFFHLSAPDFLLGWDTPQAKRNVFGLIAANPDLARAGIRLRQFGQEIIAGARRAEDSSRLGGARRRPQPADRGRPRAHSRLAAGSLRHDQDGLRPLQEGARNPQEGNPDLRQFPLAVHGPGGAGRHVGTSRRQAAFHGQQRQHHRRPARSAEVLRVHRRIGANLLLPQVALLYRRWASRTACIASGRWPGSMWPSKWARPRPTPS